MRDSLHCLDVLDVPEIVRNTTRFWPDFPINERTCRLTADVFTSFPAGLNELWIHTKLLCFPRVGTGRVDYRTDTVQCLLTLWCTILVSKVIEILLQRAAWGPRPIKHLKRISLYEWVCVVFLLYLQHDTWSSSYGLRKTSQTQSENWVWDQRS